MVSMTYDERIFFGNDYNRTAHPQVLQALVETQAHAHTGYGLDAISAQAAEKIRAAAHNPQADVHFLVGGTQANVTVVDAVLRPWEGVISPVGGHINVHETGAVEHTGHKILGVDSADGKLRASQITAVVEEYEESGTLEHMVTPKLVYISQPTEFGTRYQKDELEAIAQACRRHGLFLFVDGARLGYALSSAGNDVSLLDLARLADAFTIGGTKCGALFGEAVVLREAAVAPHFRSSIKQNLGMLAKGWLIGAQFDALFSDGLYESITARACAQAADIRAAASHAGIDCFIDSPTNQQFFVLTKAQHEALARRFVVQFICAGPTPGTDVVRVCTSWSTEDGDVAVLIDALGSL